MLLGCNESGWLCWDSYTAAVKAQLQQQLESWSQNKGCCQQNRLGVVKNGDMSLVAPL